jgi:hypothetical protein
MFVEDSTSLIGQEIELARAEVGIQVDRAKSGATLFGAAAVLLLAGLGALTACAVLALALAVDAWLAALIVGGALVIVGGALAVAGRARVKALAAPVPERAMQSIREDLVAVQDGVQAGRDDNGGEPDAA